MFLKPMVNNGHLLGSKITGMRYVRFLESRGGFRGNNNTLFRDPHISNLIHDTMENGSISYGSQLLGHGLC